MNSLNEYQKDMVSFKKIVREAFKFFKEDNSRNSSDLFLWIQACAYGVFTCIRNIIKE